MTCDYRHPHHHRDRRATRCSVAAILVFIAVVACAVWVCVENDRLQREIVRLKQCEADNVALRIKVASDRQLILGLDHNLRQTLAERDRLGVELADCRVRVLVDRPDELTPILPPVPPPADPVEIIIELVPEPQTEPLPPPPVIEKPVQKPALCPCGCGRPVTECCCCKSVKHHKGR